MNDSDIYGWTASTSLILANFSRGACRSLALATTANLAFIAYACHAGAPCVLFTHVLLLPFNAMRLRAAWRTRRTRGAGVCAFGAPGRPEVGGADF